MRPIRARKFLIWSRVFFKITDGRVGAGGETETVKIATRCIEHGEIIYQTQGLFRTDLDTFTAATAFLCVHHNFYHSTAPFLFNPLDRFTDFVFVTEGRQPEITFARGPKTATGGADHVAFLQELIKEIPF